MNLVDMAGALEIGLDGILHNRLVLIAGAGLSMAPPSNLPSAAAIAEEAKALYDAQYAGLRPPFPAGIEDQAEFFFGRNELGVFLTEYVDQHAFAGTPNSGHVAVADLLLSHALTAAVTTNVDMLIESAGFGLYGQVFVGIDGNVVAAPPAGMAPMLKIHGCWNQDRKTTVWAKGQLDQDPVKTRVENGANWLGNALLDKDLLIVGYATDWDYLNAVLEKTLGAIAPASVLVIDPSETAVFEAKAPILSALAGRAKKGAHHLRESGSVFLDALRLEFSKAFVRMAIAKGISDFELATGHPPTDANRQAPDLDNDALWRLRRDILGCGPNAPADRAKPFNEPATGLTLLRLREAGATSNGSYWSLGGDTLRVLRASGQHLHAIERRHRWEIPPLGAPDIIIAVGAEDVCLPADLVRRSDNSIVRGTGPRWITWHDYQGLL